MPVSIPTMTPPTDAELRALADCVGYSLPKSYLHFVKLHDGAEPDDNSIKTVNNVVGVRSFISVREASALSDKIEGFPRTAIPFAEDDCGNYFYIDPSDGAVYFWDHELGEADERVADDALAFVEKLTPFDASSVKLAPGQVKRAWIDPSFNPEF